MSTKHTPGPWFSGPDVEDAISGNDIIRHVIQAACMPGFMQPHVANIGGLNQTNEEIEANACLIAAAPDMYAVLNLILDDYSDGVHSMRIEQIKAAFKKASGK